MHDRELDRNVDQAPWSKSGFNDEPWGAEPGDCNFPPGNALSSKPNERREEVRPVLVGRPQMPHWASKI